MLVYLRCPGRREKFTPCWQPSPVQNGLLPMELSQSSTRSLLSCLSTFPGQLWLKMSNMLFLGQKVMGGLFLPGVLCVLVQVTADRLQMVRSMPSVVLCRLSDSGVQCLDGLEQCSSIWRECVLFIRVIAITEATWRECPIPPLLWVPALDSGKDSPVFPPLLLPFHLLSVPSWVIWCLTKLDFTLMLLKTFPATLQIFLGYLFRKT